MTNQSKTILGIGVIALIIIAIGISWRAGNEPIESIEETKEPIKIGFIGPLTGDAAVVGQNEVDAINLALENLENKIAGREVKMIIEDGKCNGQDAATAAQKLINVDGVKIILGGICSAETLGAAPIAETNKVILFSAFSSHSDITNAGDYIFRNDVCDLDGATKGAKMIRENKVAIITENSDLSIGIREILKEEFIKKGGEIVADEIYMPGEKDFRAYLTKIKATNPEAIFINPSTSTGSGGLIAKQMQELGIDVPLYGNIILGGSDSLEIAGEALEGATFFDAPLLNSENPKIRDFISMYKEKYGNPYSEWDVAARYDSVFIVSNAVEKCGENTDCIRDYFYSMPDYNGMVGTYHFDENGDQVGLEYAVKKIINGKPEMVE